MTRNRARYERVFAETYGPGPYTCHFCREEIELNTHKIHHLDHDESNDVPSNLVAAHGPCHNRYHMTHSWATQHDMMLGGPTRGHHTPHTEETKRRISEAKTGIPMDPDAAARSAASRRGLKRSEETRRRMSEARRAVAARKRAERDGH